MRQVVSIVGFLALLLATVPTRDARAGRCEAGLGDQPRCTCPDYAAILADPGSHSQCRPGWTAVVYDLGGHFPLDSATSAFTLTASNSTQCPGLVKQGMPFRGKLLGCWGPLEDDGCRAFQTPFEGQCLSLDPFTLGGTCNAKCAGLHTGMLGIGNAGNGAYRVCPPKDPSVSCRATNFRGDERFRFQTGGLCVSGGCQEGETVPGPDACQSGWGASYFGFAFHVPPGNYDWKTGAFKVMTNQKRPTCGALAACLGPRAQWVITTVGTPEDGYKPPCFTTETNACNPTECFP